MLSCSFFLKKKMPDSRTPPPDTDTLTFVLSAGIPSPPTCPKSPAQNERSKAQMDLVGELPEKVNSILLLQAEEVLRKLLL